MRARIRSMVAVGLLVLLFSACSPAISPPTGTPVPDVDNTTPWQELCTTTITLEQFIASFEEPFISEISLKPTIEDVAGSIGIECLRSPREGVWYSVHPVREGGLVYCFYHSFLFEEKYLLAYFWVPKKASLADCPEIQKEMTLSQLKRLFPQAELWEKSWNADPEFWKGSTPPHFSGSVYLTDGILRIAFQENDGQATVAAVSKRDNHFMNLGILDAHSPYNGEILPLDWPE
ncbi:MAG: hypothetical protein IJY82_07960 [Oscillospiraceae bacterium]|nr:hypothetical protein [Oscillospiraceae bacterium]